ncbi:MAG: hypothetical protein IRY97_10540 [Thermomicrobiaceae bacterium]|nr:hypothetical protein [Thermomicrobiaceae bacterium]
MRKGWLYLIVGGLVVLFVVLTVVLYMLGGADQSALERLRDISVIFLTLSGVLVVLLLGALVGVAVWLGLLLKDRVIPLLEELTATAARIRGTTEFVSEEVVSPIISVYSTVAGIRAMVKTVTGRDRKR